MYFSVRLIFYNGNIALLKHVFPYHRFNKNESTTQIILTLCTLQYVFAFFCILFFLFAEFQN